MGFSVLENPESLLAAMRGATRHSNPSSTAIGSLRYLLQWPLSLVTSLEEFAGAAEEAWAPGTAFHVRVI
jgi:hypothetical protein